MSERFSWGLVHNGGEWAEFFVRERDGVRNNGKGRQAATWVAHSSFGVFGCEWYDMGEPFREFVATADTDYVLSKIARKVPSEKKILAAVRREVLHARRHGTCSKDAAREAFDCIESLAQDCISAEVLAHSLYEASELSFVEWSDMGDTTEWEGGAARFMEKIWPTFVEQVKAGALRILKAEGTA